MSDAHLRIRLLPLLFILPLALTGCSGLQHPPATSHDGLVLAGSKPLDTVYKKPGVDLANYQRLMVTDCSVAFKSDWQREHNTNIRHPGGRVTEQDMANIQAQLGTLCREVFVEELTKDGGYQIVDTAAADVLKLQPKIIDLDITAPDVLTAGRSRVYTTSEGAMTLYLEIYDSVSGEILGRVIDERTARDMGQLEWTNAVTNKREAERILRRWAKTLRDMLDNAWRSK